jgi:hypothetical protein
MMSERVAVNEFVRRQTKESGKSFSSQLSFEDIALHAEVQMSAGNFKEGYRDGVRLVAAAADIIKQFTCPFVKIDVATELSAKYVQRRLNENFYIQVRAKAGTLLKAGKVELILYRHDVLEENDEQSTTAEWELISFHALPEGIDEMPMGPVTMMRNQLELPGGTKANYSVDEWAFSVEFWQHYAILETDQFNSS